MSHWSTYLNNSSTCCFLNQHMCLNGTYISLRHQAAPCCILWHPGPLAPPTVFVLWVLCRGRPRGGGAREWERQTETESERGTGYTEKMYQVRHPWMNVSVCEWMWLCLTQVRLKVLSCTVILKEYVLLSFLLSYRLIPLKCPLISISRHTHITQTHRSACSEPKLGKRRIDTSSSSLPSSEPTVCWPLSAVEIVKTGSQLCSIKIHRIDLRTQSMGYTCTIWCNPVQQLCSKYLNNM